MYCIGKIKQLKYGYFGTQAVSITSRPCLFPSAALLEINMGSKQWKLPISLITILKLYIMDPLKGLYHRKVFAVCLQSDPESYEWGFSAKSVYLK